MSNKDNLHRYVDCGLDNVYLNGGFEVEETPYGKAVSITDLDGLHKSIAQCLISKPQSLTGKEFRFLRTELDLSQETMGELCGVNDRTIRKWENEDESVKDPANMIVRVIYRERYDPAVTYENLSKKIRRLQQLDKQLFELMLSSTDNGWQASNNCEAA
jgi:DNA-binding transcriptional regulator YiaG